MATSTPSRPQATARGRLPAPVRDRRPALAALALLLVIGGALISALVAYRSGDRVDVLVASDEITLGQTVQRGDFRIARVASEGASYLDASVLDRLEGRRAVVAIPGGTLINGSMFSTSTIVPDDGAYVGVVLSSTQRPVGGLAVGDVVTVFSVPRDASGAQATPLLSRVRVAEAGRVDNSGGQAVSLLVRAEQTGTLIGATTTSEVSVTKLAPGTKPDLDFVKE